MPTEAKEETVGKLQAEAAERAKSKSPAAPELKLLSFKSAKCGSRSPRPCEVYATADATVLDLMAAANSDAVWLKADDDDLGTHLTSMAEQKLVDVVDASKHLSIVRSCVLQDRGGNAAKVKIEETEAKPEQTIDRSVRD